MSKSFQVLGRKFDVVQIGITLTIEAVLTLAVFQLIPSVLTGDVTKLLAIVATLLLIVLAPAIYLHGWPIGIATNRLRGSKELERFIYFNSATLSPEGLTDIKPRIEFSLHGINASSHNVEFVGVEGILRLGTKELGDEITLTSHPEKIAPGKPFRISIRQRIESTKALIGPDPSEIGIYSDIKLALRRAGDAEIRRFRFDTNLCFERSRDWHSKNYDFFSHTDRSGWMMSPLE